MSGRRPSLTLYARAYCHLCDEMVEALSRLRATHPFRLETIDVDADPALEARYGERVPVLCADQRELCHYRLDTAAVAAYLAGFD